MSDHHLPSEKGRLRFAASWAAVLALLVAVAGGRPDSAGAADPPAAASKTRTAVAKSASPAGMIWRREKPGADWQALGDQDAVPSEDLLVGLSGAALESKSGARLTFLGDLNGQSPYPIIETAVVLHDNPKADLDFTLDRGRVDVTNRKDKGAAHVRVHVWKESWDLTLAEPGTRIALEVYGRWQPGVPFVKDAPPSHVPFANLLFLVLKGEVDLKHGAHQFALAAPPGPALFQWDNIDGPDLTPHRLDKLPPWADQREATTPEGKEKKAAIERFRQLALSKGPKAALAEYLNSDNPTARRFAVYALGAMDDLKELSNALNHAKHPDVWENGVVAVRHWIGRSPGQDMKLYRTLTEEMNIPPGQAETILQLLHSFGEVELSRPETYELLIAYLNHDRLGIRGLAHWHLYRLVPAGRSIKYDPLAPEADRKKAQAEWKKLIPPGKLPPKPKSNGS
jgi:hypothetical protein